ncbi:Potassium transporter [Tilletia horrida]|nr:Potassium transporter [Tilletia horrida]
MGCCGGNSDWKREEVLDHKFDFIDVREYRDTGVMTQLKYTLLYANMAKSVAVYLADMYTAISLNVMGHFSGGSGALYNEAESGTLAVSIVYSRWIFTGCIIFSFLLLAYEAHKAKAIIRSRDISYAYTNIMANDWYSLNSYDHFCFFQQINNSKKKKDEFAFFIFFTFKGWKRLLVADGPRQVINAFVLFSVAAKYNFTSDVYQYYQGNVLTGIMLITMIFTVTVFAASAFLLAIAALMYIPLIIHIKGNLKEYCCHKIDKRISELVRRKKKTRMARQVALARKEAQGDFSHLKNKKGEVVGRAIPQPTLPNVEVDLYSDSGSTLNNTSAGKGGYAPSITGTDKGAMDGYDAGYAGTQEGYLMHHDQYADQASQLGQPHDQHQQGGYGAGYALHDDPTGAYRAAAGTPGLDSTHAYRAAAGTPGLDPAYYDQTQTPHHGHQAQASYDHQQQYYDQQQYYAGQSDAGATPTPGSGAAAAHAGYYTNSPQLQAQHGMDAQYQQHGAYAQDQAAQNHQYCYDQQQQQQQQHYHQDPPHYPTNGAGAS